MLPNRFLPAVVALAVFLICTANAQFQEYDKACKTDADCLSGSFLYCNQNEKCDCLVVPGLVLVHDPVTKKCLIPSGTSCHLQSEPNEPTCTSRSTCTKPEYSNDPLKGFCTCDIGYQQIEKNCVAKIPIDGACEIPSSSNPLVRQCVEFAECNRYSNTCNCADGLNYDREHKECTLKTGATCHIIPEIGKEPTCASGALCERKEWITNPSLGQCTCATDFVNLPNENRCLRKNVPIGEYCEADKPAEIHSCDGLSTCQNEKCECAVKGADVIEDHDAKKCALAVGSPCHKIINPAVEVTCSSNSACLTPSWSEDGTRGLCTCSNKFEINPQSRTCLRLRHIGEACEAKSPIQFNPSCIEYSACDPTSKQCNCWNHFETTDGDNSTCNLKGSGLEDDPCFLNAPDSCQEHAACERLPEDDLIGTCKCGRGYKSNSERMCLWTPNPYNGACEENIECNHRNSMHCSVSGQCDCFRPDTMVYNETLAECLTVVDSTGICSVLPDEAINTKCIRNAECKADSNNPNVGRCECSRGYKVNTGKLCDWSPSNYDDLCEVSLECDHRLSMACVNGKCVCFRPFTMVYNATINECLTLSGEDGICNLVPSDGVHTKCVENAECKPLSNPIDPTLGFCECLTGYKPNTAKMCPRTPNNYGDACKVNIECDLKLSMSCNNENCGCMRPESMIYNETSKECFTLVGNDGICSLDPNAEVVTKCVDSAECKADSSDPKIGRCECSEGFDATESKVCAANVNNGAQASVISSSILMIIVIHALASVLSQN